MENKEHVLSFYGIRKAMTPTTLHDGNIDQYYYQEVTNLRKLFCREAMPSRRERKFMTEGYNKENVHK